MAWGRLGRILLWCLVSNQTMAGTLWKDASQSHPSSARTALNRVARMALPSVVALSTRAASASAESLADEGFGTAFIIHPSGFLLTASHVVEGTVSIQAHVSSATGASEVFPARVVGLDAESDIALLKIEAPKPLPALELASSQQVEVADWVVVVGNPFGLSQSVTVGIISFKGRLDVVPQGRQSAFDFLQTDAAINPGNSGGPVLDMRGKVIAIANSVNVSGQGIGFATPIDLAKKVIPHLQKHGRVRRGFLGISLQHAPSAVLSVADVERPSPAWSAGILPGDIILKADGRTVYRTQELVSYVHTLEIGHRLKLRIRRNSKEIRLTVRLGPPPPLREGREVGR